MVDLFFYCVVIYDGCLSKFCHKMATILLVLYCLRTIGFYVLLNHRAQV